MTGGKVEIGVHDGRQTPFPRHEKPAYTWFCYVSIANKHHSRHGKRRIALRKAAFCGAKSKLLQGGSLSFACRKVSFYKTEAYLSGDTGKHFTVKIT